MCFNHCADNLFIRDLSADESNCLDKCVLKFSNVNQRIMSAYVHEQSIINERRMKEMEDQMKAANLQATAAAETTETASIANSNNELNKSIEMAAPTINTPLEGNQTKSVTT